MTEPQDRIERLDETTSRQLLGSARLGRVALNDQPSPTVLPVNYIVHDDLVVFRTVEGRKLDAADDGQAASFQVDGVDPGRETGWSVLVRGRLEEILDPSSELLDAVYTNEPLAGGRRPYLVGLSIDDVTGRRIAQDRAWVRAHSASNTWRGQDGSDLLG